MNIRPLTGDDLLQVVTLEAENPSPWSIPLVQQELDNPRAILLAGEVRGRVAAWLSATFIPPEAELLKIAVAASCRRCGYADLLLADLLEKLACRQCTALYLEVRSRNLPALKFYQKNGFLKRGKRASYFDDPIDDALVLCREFEQK